MTTMKEDLVRYPHQRLRLKTYSHLATQGRMPTEYELVTSRLLYYPGRGFEVKTPIVSWYEKYQSGSPFQCGDWEKFKDPRETTYTKYVRLQSDKEKFVEGVFDVIESTGRDRELDSAWVRVLSETLSPLRFPYHGFQMISSYVGSMAPAGRIAIACAFQAADEIRKNQVIAYRMRQLREVVPTFGEDGKEIWQTDSHWQPLREAVERLLVTYDWGEAFVGLNLCLKPAVDGIFLTSFPRLARARGDFHLEELFFSLGEDSLWQRDWSRELVRVAVADRPENKEVIRRWIEKWRPLAAAVEQSFAAKSDEYTSDIFEEISS